MKKVALLLAVIMLVAIGSLACSAQPAGIGGNESAAPAEEGTTQSAEAKTEKKPVVGFSNWSRSFEFYVDMEAGIKEVADKLGIEVITQDPNGELTEQTKQLENFITRKVDGIILVPIDSEASGDEIEMVNKANIPIVTLDIQATGGGEVVCHLESNNYMGGQLSADFIAEQLGGKGKVAIIDNPTITPLIARTKGFTDRVAEKYPDIEIVTTQSGDSKREKGLAVAENILQKTPDLDAFYCTNDIMGMGALQAVQVKGLDTIIVGFAAEQEALLEIQKDGNYKASFSQEPKAIGETGMEMMAKILNGETVEDFIAVDVGLVTKDNVDQYLK